MKLVALEAVVELAHDVDGLLGGLDQLVQLRIEIPVSVEALGQLAHGLHVHVDRHHGGLGLLQDGVKCNNTIILFSSFKIILFCYVLY